MGDLGCCGGRGCGPAGEGAAVEQENNAVGRPACCARLCLRSFLAPGPTGSPRGLPVHLPRAKHLPGLGPQRWIKAQLPISAVHTASWRKPMRKRNGRRGFPAAAVTNPTNSVTSYTGTDCLALLEIRSPKWPSGAVFPSGDSGEESVSLHFLLPEAARVLWLGALRHRTSASIVTSSLSDPPASLS